MAQQSQAATIAKQPAACCLKSDIRSGTPRGRTVDVAGIETYIAEPTKDIVNGNILLYFPDVHGLFVNSQLLMDAYADAGCGRSYLLSQAQLG